MGLLNWLFKPQHKNYIDAETEQMLRVKHSGQSIGFQKAPLSEDPFAHKICTVCVALPDETWPEWDGKPMVGMLQINLTRLEWVPEVLSGYEMITLYTSNIFEKGTEFPENGNQNGQGWLVRAYPRVNALVPIRPYTTTAKYAGRPHDLAPRPIRIEAPPPDDLVGPDPNDEYSQMTKKERNTFNKQYPVGDRTKVGGYPMFIQGPYLEAFLEDYTHAFQVCSDDAVGLNIVDGGAFYLARNSNAAPTNEWLFELQCF